MKALIVFAPNWLGDAVMALPAIADVHRAAPDLPILVAARPAVAPLFQLVPEVSRTIDLSPPNGDGSRFSRLFSAVPAESRAIRSALETTPVPVSGLLLPNSFRAALVAARAGIADRWGYATDWRRRLLTRAVDVPAQPVHQAEYYQQLTTALGFPAGPLEPRVEVPAHRRADAARLLEDSGWDGRTPLVALAPGAAYGGAKRWPPARYADLAAHLAADGATAVIVGTAADARTARELVSALGGRGRVINLIGRTDLPTLGGVLASCRAIVSNDSGAMHFAAATGLPVVAVFGPTNERATAPLSAGGRAGRVILEPVDCRPCMLRECPIDHRCMERIPAAAVYAAVREAM